MMPYRLLTSREGDTLDALIWREASLGPSALAAVMAANRGVADLGAMLPAGTKITIPADAPETSSLPLINLWD